MTWSNYSENFLGVIFVSEFMNRLVATFFGPFLNKYFYNINSSQIEIQILRGRAQIHDLIFKEECFIHHQIPFYIRRGVVNTLSLFYSSEQVRIEINNLILIGSEVFNNTFVSNNSNDLPKSILKKFLLPILQSILRMFFNSSFDSMRELFKNLTISIQKVHVRFEKIMNASQALGIVINSINMFSIDHRGEKTVIQNDPPTIDKRVTVNNFGIYFDTEATNINLSSDDFESQMIVDMSNRKHQFILNPISLNCIFTYNTRSHAITKMKLLLNELKMTINQDQYEIFKTMLYNFEKQRLYSYFELLNKRAIQCLVFQQTKKYLFNVNHAIDFLKNRNEFYHIWRNHVSNPTRYKKEYNDFISRLNPRTLCLLSSYSSMKLMNQDEVQLYEENEVKNPIEFEIAVETEIQFCLKDRNGKAVSLVIDDFKANGKRWQDLNSSSQKMDHSFKFEARSIYVNNLSNINYLRIFDENKTINGSISFDYLNPMKVDLNIPSLSGTLDINMVSMLMNFFGDTSILREILESFSFRELLARSKKETEIKNLINSRQMIKLSLHVDNLNFLIPYVQIDDERPVFQITLAFAIQSKSIYTRYDINNIDSLFNVYGISIKKLQMFLNEKEISNKIDIESTLKYKIAPIVDGEIIQISNQISNIEGSIQLDLTIFQILLLQQIFLYLSDKLKSNEDFEEENKQKQKESILKIFPEFIAKIDIMPISILVTYEEASSLSNRHSFKLNVDEKTSIDISNKKQIFKANLKNNSGIEGEVFFPSENGKFIKTKNFILDITSFESLTQIDFNIINFELFAEAIPLKFLFVLAEFPIDYEWMLNLKEDSSIKKYLYIRNKSLKKSNKVKLNVKINEVCAHLIDVDFIKNEKSTILTLETDKIAILLNKVQEKTAIKIEIDPPQATTKQFGNIWENIILKKENLFSPIIINLTPVSVSFCIEYFQANISYILLYKIIKFALIAKNPYSHKQGDPETVKYLKFDVKSHKVIIKIIYDIESKGFYEMNVSNFEFKTIKSPIEHLLLLKDFYIVQKMQSNANKEKLLFQIRDLNLTLKMHFLLRDNVDQIKPTSFNDLLEKNGLDKWTISSNKFIDTEDDELILSKSYFYFYALTMNFNMDQLLFIYSHESLRNILFLTSRLLKLLTNDSLESIDRPLNIAFKLQMQKGDFQIVDEAYLIMASLILDSVCLQIDPKKLIYNVFNEKIIILDDRKQTILETSKLNIETIDEKIYARLESLSLFLKLKYLPDGINYIMKCPLFSFADDFKENIQKSTSFEMKNSLFMALNNFIVQLPVENNLFCFYSSFDISLTPDGNIANFYNNHMILNDKLIIKEFSIQYSNNVWNVDPILITFSVYNIHIIYQLIKEYMSLTMPPIYSFRIDAELQKRKFAINLNKISFILTQPNLPFISLIIMPSRLEQSFSSKNEKIIKYKIDLLLQHENYSNYGTDTIIDPFFIFIQSATINHKTYINAIISPVNISLPFSFLSEIFQFRKKYKYYQNSDYSTRVFQERVVFFKNDTGMAIQIYLFKNDSAHIEANVTLNDNKPFNLRGYDLSSKIKVLYQNRYVNFSIKDLCYPMFYDKTVVVYIDADAGIQTIHFSSPYIVKNQLSYNIDIFIDNIKMGTVKKESELPIPLNLVPYLSKGMKAVTNSDNFKIAPSFKVPDDIKNQPKSYKFVDYTFHNNFYASVCLSNDQQHSFCSISFLPFITFENQLPIPIMLTFVDFYNVQSRLTTGQMIDASFIKDKITRLDIKITMEQFGESKVVTISKYTKSSDIYKISIKQGNEIKCVIALFCKYDNKTETYHHIIYTPCVLYNNTGIDLKIKDSNNTFYPFLNGMCIYTPNESLNDSKKVPLRVIRENLTKINKDQIDCMEAKSIQTFSLPYVSDESIFLPISAVKKDSLFENTVYLTLNIYLTVYNHLETRFSLLPSNAKNDPQFVTVCPPKQRSLIRKSNVDGTFTFSINGYRYCSGVNLKNQTTTVFRLINKDKSRQDIFIQLDLIKEKNGFCGHFSYPSFPPPLVISNNTDRIISVKAATELEDNPPLFVNCSTTSIFAKPQPFIERSTSFKNSVVLKIIDDNHVVVDKSISIIIPFVSDISPKQIQNSKYYFEVKTTNRGDKMIHVYDPKYIIEKDKTPDNLVQVELLNFSVYISKIEISFIDKLVRELCLLTIRSVHYKFMKKQESIIFTIGSLCLNDMHNAAKSPVVLCGKNPQLLKIELKSAHSLKMRSYESIDIEIAPLQLYIDEFFISDLFYALNDVINDSKFVQEEDQNQQKEVEEYERFLFYSVSQFRISPISIDLAKINSQKRDYRFPCVKNFKYFKILFFPFDLHKTFDEFMCKSIRTPFHSFANSLYEFYLNQISFSDLLSVFSSSSASSEMFIDIIDENENDKKNYEKKEFLSSPERIPRAFPMNRITSTYMDKNNKAFCPFALAQLAFQKNHPDEYLALLIFSNIENAFLAIFNHFVAVLSKKFQDVKTSIKLSDLIIIDNHDNVIHLKDGRNNAIRFECESEKDVLKILAIIRSFAGRIHFFGF